MAANPSKSLPEALLNWIAKTAGSSVMSHHRLAKVRREAWQIECSDGQSYFLRIERGFSERANSGTRHARDLKRETELIEYLNAHTSLKTQTILGWNEEHGAVLQSMEAGSGDLHKADRKIQHTVMLDFVDELARLHNLDVSQMKLEGFQRPTSARDHSLLELEAIARTMPPVTADSAGPEDLLAKFSVRFLEKYAPDTVQKTVLVQGDTGAGNFMFDGDTVSATVDWELAHFGDPMEDLGNMVARDYFQPSAGGDLTPYFQAYAEKTGFHVDRQTVTYYLVHQMSRSVLSLAAVTRYPDWRSNLALNIAYTGVCCRVLCQAMGRYLNQTEPSVTPIPAQLLAGDSLHNALAKQQTRSVLDTIEDNFAQYTGRSIADMLELLGREKSVANEVEAEEIRRISNLAGRPMENLQSARSWLFNTLDSAPTADLEQELLDHFWWWSEQRIQVLGKLAAPWEHCHLASY